MKSYAIALQQRKHKCLQMKERQEESSDSDSDSDSYASSASPRRHTDAAPTGSPAAAHRGDRSPTFRARASPQGSPMRMHKDALGCAESPGGGGARVWMNSEPVSQVCTCLLLCPQLSIQKKIVLCEFVTPVDGLLMGS